METKSWWNDKETQCCLNIIKNENVILKLNQGSMPEKQIIYNLIHTKMVKLGYPRTAYQVKNKWKTLKVLYKKDKKKLKNNIGSKLWFHLLEDLLETKINSMEMTNINAEISSHQSEATIINTNDIGNSSSLNEDNFPSTSFSPDLGLITQIFTLKDTLNNVQSRINSANNSYSDASWWKDPETKRFLEIFREENALEHIKNGSVHSIYEVMHAKMVNAGFTRTVEQLKNKWKTLKSNYLKNKDQLRASGSGTWFPILDDLFNPKSPDQTLSDGHVINFTEKHECNEAPMEIISTDADSVDEITKDNIYCSTENDYNLSSEFFPKINPRVSRSQTNRTSKRPTHGSWWNDEETYYYLKIIKKENALNLINCKSGTMTLPIFELIHAKMVNGGFNRTLQQIINKWKSLNSIYKRETERFVNSDKIWFPVLEELLGKKKMSNRFANMDAWESSKPCEEIILESDESNASCDSNSDSMSLLSPEVILEVSSNEFNSPKSTFPMKITCQGSWWSREETNCYLNILKKENLIKSMSDKNQRRIDSFIVIYQKMKAAGFNRSLEQIRNRWKSLRMLYMYINDKKQSKPKCYDKNVDRDWNNILDEMFNENSNTQSENVAENCTASSPQQSEGKSLPPALRKDSIAIKDSLDSATPSVSSEPDLPRIVSSPLKDNSTTSQMQEPSKPIDDGSNNNYMEQQMKFLKEMIKEEHKFIEKMIKQHKMDTTEMLSTISNNMMSTMEKLIQVKPTINLSLGQILPTPVNPEVTTNDPQFKSDNGSK